MDILNITNGPVFDETIWEKEYHTHNPYASSTFGNNDEIRIPIHQQDTYTLPSESYIYIEGRVTKKDGTTASTVPFINNPMPFLFDKVAIEICGVVVDSVSRVGVTTTIKSLLSYTPQDINKLKNAGWVAPENLTFVPSTDGYFNFCVPLNMVLGFAEDYTRILINVKQELVLLRGSSDEDLILAPAGTTVDKLEWKLDLQKISWRVPHLKLADENKISMLKHLQSDREIVMAFRSWEMHEYPSLPATQRQSWTVKTSTNLEKPRYIAFALQNKKRRDILQNAGTFDHCKIINVKVYVNSTPFPYDNFNASFSKGRCGILFHMFTRFQSSYFYKSDHPLITLEDYIKYFPIILIDCSKQNEAIKSSTADIRIEFETEENIPQGTTAYCLILHDSIVTYTPLSNSVRRVL